MYISPHYLASRLHSWPPVPQSLAHSHTCHTRDRDRYTLPFYIGLKHFPMAIHLTCADLAHFGQTIPKYAFKDRKDIGSVVIPGTVATIEANAFQRCVNLKQVRVITCGCAWQWHKLIIANITCTFLLLHLILTHNVQYSTTPHAALFIPRTSSCAVACMPASGLPTSILTTVLRSIPT